MDATSLETCRQVVAALARRGYEAEFAATAAEAADCVMREAASAASVAWGGSESVKALGVKERLAAAGKEIREHQMAADLFLLSANALLADGRIVNIDGNGNRVAASICGPKRVVFVIGVNKIVAGGLDDAVARIRRCACPPNARRLGRKTPCALTGVCADCDSPDRMCKVMTVFERRPTHTPTKVILVGEPLGY